MILAVQNLVDWLGNLLAKFSWRYYRCWCSSYSGGGTARGEVRVYQKNNDSWLQLGNDLNGAADNDNFGHSVDLNGDGTILAVGTKDNSHKTIIYKYDSGSWSLYGNTIDNQVS